MAQVLQSSPSSSITYAANDGDASLINPPIVSCSSPVAAYRRNTRIVQEEYEEEDEEEEYEEVGISGKKREREEGDQLSLLAVLVTVFRKSLVSCRSVGGGVEDRISSAMEISCPTNVRHVAHVTFDRFNGFLGLPVEFEPEVPRRPPSASTRVFGVSTKSMQLSFDTRGNSVPTILLMMQRRLYSNGGLEAEGIFRINAENGQEEHVREQLNRGIVPGDVDIHCLAGLIKAWFRELPTGLLDSLPPERVMEAQSEEECSQLVRELPSTEGALLDWAINLMADVAQMEHLNKMNARNVAMVFAPNMTQMADPLTALMYAVQVMNFLKTLIVRTLRERVDSILDDVRTQKLEPSDDNGHHGAPQPITWEENEANQEEQQYHSAESDERTFTETTDASVISTSEITPVDEKENLVVKHYSSDFPYYAGSLKDGIMSGGKFQSKSRRTKSGQSSNVNAKKVAKKFIERPVVHVNGNRDRSKEKEKEVSIICRLNSQTERVEAWR